MEAHEKGMRIAQEQDDLHRLLDILEKDLSEGVADENTQQVLFTRIEQFVGQKPTTIEEARELINDKL